MVRVGVYIDSLAFRSSDFDSYLAESISGAVDCGWNSWLFQWNNNGLVYYPLHPLFDSLVMLTQHRYTATTLMVVILVNGLGAWPASSVVASEVSTLHLRAKSQGISWFTNGLAAGVMGFVLPYIFNPDEGDLKAKTGFVYGGMGAIAVMVTWFIVPEMKGRNWVEIDRLFEERVSARNFERSGRGVTVDRGVDGEERGEKGL